MIARRSISSVSFVTSSFNVWPANWKARRPTRAARAGARAASTTFLERCSGRITSLERALDLVLELADVAGPVVTEEEVERVGTDLARDLGLGALLVGDLLDHEVDE